MKNVAKINLEANCCKECPFCQKPKGYASYFCAHDLKTPGLDVGDGEQVPDFCPFVLKRLENVLNAINETSAGSVPKKYLNQIEKRQVDDPNPKFGADHGFRHADRVFQYGEKFLSDLISHGLNTPNSIQKQTLMLKIASKLHDIGLAETMRNHAFHSAELAKKYLSSKVDIDEQDAYEIVHAIGNHSDGNDTVSLLDAALLIGDKLDITKERIIRTTDPITVEILKVETVEYAILGKFGTATGAELRYTTSGNFKVAALSEWPKCIEIPRRVAKDFLEVPFRFIVDGTEVDSRKIVG